MPEEHNLEVFSLTFSHALTFTYFKHKPLPENHSDDYCELLFTSLFFYFSCRSEPFNRQSVLPLFKKSSYKLGSLLLNSIKGQAMGDFVKGGCSLLRMLLLS